MTTGRWLRGDNDARSKRRDMSAIAKRDEESEEATAAMKMI